MADVDRLFDELAAAYVRGERPDLASYLARAGEDADDLARLFEAFLRTVPLPEPTDDDVAVLRARLVGEPGLLALRTRRGRKVDDVVDDLAGRLEVDDRTRLKRYYQRLEGGVLDPHPVDERVWSALRDVFGTSIRTMIRPLATRQGGSAMAYYRRTGSASASADSASPPARAATPAEPRSAADLDPAPADRDELDRLFLGSD
jgi:hypothetical protein